MRCCEGIADKGGLLPVPPTRPCQPPHFTSPPHSRRSSTHSPHAPRAGLAAPLTAIRRRTWSCREKHAHLLLGRERREHRADLRQARLSRPCVHTRVGLRAWRREGGTRRAYAAWRAPCTVDARRTRTRIASAGSNCERCSSNFSSDSISSWPAAARIQSAGRMTRPPDPPTAHAPCSLPACLPGLVLAGGGRPVLLATVAGSTAEAGGTPLQTLGAPRSLCRPPCGGSGGGGGGGFCRSVALRRCVPEWNRVHTGKSQ